MKTNILILGLLGCLLPTVETTGISSILEPSSVLEEPFTSSLLLGFSDALEISGDIEETPSLSTLPGSASNSVVVKQSLSEMIIVQSSPDVVQSTTAGEVLTTTSSSSSITEHATIVTSSSIAEHATIVASSSITEHATIVTSSSLTEHATIVTSSSITEHATIVTSSSTSQPVSSRSPLSPISTSTVSRTAAPPLSSSLPRQTPSPALSCPMNTSFGIQWQQTAAGGTVMTNCTNGTAKRSCRGDGRWEDPDLSDCVSESFTKLWTILERSRGLTEQEEESLPRELKVAVGGVQHLTGKDLVVLVGVVRSIVRLTPSVASADDNVKTRMFVENTLDAVDIVLNSSVQRIWNTVSMSSDSHMRRLPSTLLEQLETLSLQLATYGPSDGSEEVYKGQNIVIIHGHVALPNVDGLSLPNESSSRELYAMYPHRDVPRVSIPAKFISDRLHNTSSENVPYAYAMFSDIAQFTPCEKCGTSVVPVSRMLSLKLGIDEKCPLNTSMVTMEFGVSENDVNVLDEPKCSFYNFTSHQWSSYAMRTRRNRNKPVVTCHSFHLTSFVVTQGEKTYQVTENYSLFVYIGCGIFLFVALLGVLLLLCTGFDLCKRVQNLVHLNFAVSMAAVALALILGLHPLQSLSKVYFDLDLSPVAVCRISTTIIHYFVLATFAWLLCEAILLVAMVTRLKSRCIGCGCFLFFAGWVFPAAPVVCVALLGHPYVGLNSDKQIICWIGSELNTEIAYWLPIGVFAILSFLLALGTLIVICMRKDTFQSGDDTKNRYYDTRVMSIGVLVLVIAMVITWVMAELLIRMGHLAVAAFFLVLIPIPAFILDIMFICRNTFCGGKCSVFGKKRNQGRYNLWEAEHELRENRSKRTEGIAAKAEGQSEQSDSELKRRPSNNSVTFCKRPIYIASSDAVSISADTLTAVGTEMVTYVPAVDLSRQSSFGEHNNHVIENHVTTTGDDDGSICSRDDRSGTETSI